MTRPDDIPLPLSASRFVRARAQVLREILPHTRAVLRPLNEALRGRACLVPRRPENKALASAIGSAMEFALGWHHGAQPARLVERVRACGLPGRRLAKVLAAALIELRDMNATLDDAPDLLAPPLLLLGIADATYRAGCALPSMSPVTLGMLRDRRAYLDPPLCIVLAESVSSSASRELAELMARSATVFAELGAIEYNPAFYSFGFVVGADADCIADRTVIELKVLGGDKPELDPEHLWQLLCYATLDDAGPAPRGIEKVGFLELRRQFRWSATLEDIALQTAGSSWSDVRAELLRAFAGEWERGQ